MNAEYMFRHQPAKENLDTALLEIKDLGSLLEIANEYLCEKVFLENVGPLELFAEKCQTIEIGYSLFRALYIFSCSGIWALNSRKPSN